MNDFRDLEMWKKSRVFCSEIDAITATFPESEKSGLAHELRKGAYLISQKIGNGSELKCKYEFSVFLRMAIGMVVGLKSDLHKSLHRKLINQSEFDFLIDELNSLTKMIVKFRSTLDIIW